MGIKLRTSRSLVRCAITWPPRPCSSNLVNRIPTVLAETCRPSTGNGPDQLSVLTRPRGLTIIISGWEREKRQKLEMKKKIPAFRFFSLCSRKKRRMGEKLRRRWLSLSTVCFHFVSTSSLFFCWQVCKRGRCCFPESESSGSGKKWGLFRNLLRFFFFL